MRRLCNSSKAATTSAASCKKLVLHGLLGLLLSVVTVELHTVTVEFRSVTERTTAIGGGNGNVERLKPLTAASVCDADDNSSCDKSSNRTGPLVYVKFHKVGGSAMARALHSMSNAAAPWPQCSTFSPQGCSIYGKGHDTFRRLLRNGLPHFMAKHGGSVLAITFRDPGDRLLSMAAFRLGSFRNEGPGPAFLPGTNQTALQLFQDDVRGNVNGSYTRYLKKLLGQKFYNSVCLLAHDEGFSAEECADTHEHLTEKLPKASEALRSFDVMGLTDDFAASALMAGLAAGWDPAALTKYAEDMPPPVPPEDADFEVKRKEVPNRICWDDLHEENRRLLLESKLFQAEIKLFEEARRLHRRQFCRLFGDGREGACGNVLAEFREKYDANSLVTTRGCGYATLP